MEISKHITLSYGFNSTNGSIIYEVCYYGVLEPVWISAKALGCGKGGEWWQIHTLHRLLILKYRITILSWFPRTVSLYETLPQSPFRRHIVLTNRGLRGFGFSVFPEGVSTCVADSLAVGVAFHSVDFAVEDLLLTRKLKF